MRTAVDWKMRVPVGIFTAQVFQDAHLSDIGAQSKQSTPTGVAYVDIGRNALATPRAVLANGAEAGCDPLAITPGLERIAPE